MTRPCLAAAATAAGGALERGYERRFDRTAGTEMTARCAERAGLTQEVSR